LFYFSKLLSLSAPGAPVSIFAGSLVRAFLSSHFNQVAKIGSTALARPSPSFALSIATVMVSAGYVAGRHPASAQSWPLTAAFVSIKQMASAISSGLISRFKRLLARISHAR